MHACMHVSMYVFLHVLNYIFVCMHWNFQAFMQAWKEACSNKGAVIVVVPIDKTYRLKPIRFSGPCKANLTVEVRFN